MTRGDSRRPPRPPRRGRPAATELAPGPLGTGARFQAELDSGSSRGRAPSTPMFHRRESWLSSSRFEGPWFLPFSMSRAGGFILSHQMLLGGAFSPAKIVGLGDGVLLLRDILLSRVFAHPRV